MEGIKTKDLAIGYDKTLIDDISLNVVPGKIMTIIGPNGCGKSTLLKTLTGELKKKYGSVYLGGKDMDEISENEAAKQMAEVITKRIDPELMTCLEVVEMGRYPYTGRFGILSKEDKEIAFSALDTVNAADLKDRDFTQISDGQRQRVMLARAICQEPKVLVLDEPTSYLDIKHRIEIMSCIKRLATEKNVAVIMSLHELESAMRISDYVVALGEGKILRYGS
ncbi:MAG TPA: iron ABC transporter ATP-binding protein, partial [Lachnospiraceae bacterium]|nr:iron ABC transporter ATP-binding protein [Lachnospiraceae bacterium]